jgi:hypothetical protein
MLWFIITKAEATCQPDKINMQFGIATIHEPRDAQGLSPVPRGDKRWSFGLHLIIRQPISRETVMSYRF